MFFQLLCVIFLLLSIVQALSQKSNDLDKWQMRLFGQISSIYVNEDIIYYHNTLNQNGKFFKATGQVQSRNTYIMCDFFNYVKYETNQKVVHLFNNGFSILGQWEINDKIDYCLIGLNGEFIIISSQTIFSTINERFQKKIEYQIIYAGYIFEIPILVIQKKNQICIFSIRGTITEDYCIISKKGGKVIEFGKTLIYYDNYYAYHLKDKMAKEINIELIRKTCQFLGFTQTFVIRTKNNKQIVDMKGQIEYVFHSNLYVVENVETQKYYFLVTQEQNHLIIKSLDRETQKLSQEIIELNSKSNILSAFLIDLSKKQFLVQFSDLQTVLLENKLILWQTEQSLISIDSIFYQKYENEKQTYKNSYYESLQQNSLYNLYFIFQNTILRVINEIQDFQEMVTQFINGEDNQQIKNHEMEQSFGLKQKVCFLTTYNTLLCYDTKDFQLILKLQINNFDQTFKFLAVHQIDPNFVQKHDYKVGSNKHILFYYSDQRKKLYTFILDISRGSIQQVASRRSNKIIWTIPYKIENVSNQYNNLIILIDEDYNVFTYPNNDHFNSKEIILYRNDNGVLIGYKLYDKQLIKIWTIIMRDKILLIRSSYQQGQDNPRVANWDDKKVIFKLIDYTNFAILTTDEDSLKLYIVNAKTGKILFQGVQNEADFDQQINLVFDEHQVFVTYYNQAQMIFEIWTVEIYHTQIECSFIKMLEHYYFVQDPIIKNYYQTDYNAVFLQQVYGYPLGIKYLGISRTRKSMTKKNLLIITTFGQLHSLDRNLVSARRRNEKSNLEFSLLSTDLPLYQYELPIDFQSMLTYDQSFDFEKFSLETTNLESSALLLVYGSDIFFTIITPDKTYDMLQSNFNQDAILLTIVLIALAIRVLQKLVKSSNYVKQFKVN